jgi:hypothetical protein
MKRSELKIIGYYRITPPAWGEAFIITDKNKAYETIQIELGEDDFDKLENITIMIDRDIKYYAVLDENLYRECQNPNEVTDGLAEFYDSKWKKFEQ